MVDLTFTTEQERFRSRLREWLSDRLPGWRERHGTAEDPLAARLAWEREVYAGGWSGPSWPKAYGGLGLSVVEQLIYYEEMAAADAPEEVNRVGLRILGPTLIDSGTAAQKERYLPPILRAEELWCQGFSEPEAGSDLAAVRTSARLDKDRFIVTGQKIWTTNAQLADHMFALVRTDPDAAKHKGLSYLIIDMRAPGVTVRPIRDLSGNAEFNEVFLEEVQVPRDNIVGELHRGWEQARRSLAYERTLNIAPRIVRVRQQVRALAQQLAAVPGAADPGGTTVTGSAGDRERLARSFVDARVMQLAAYRSVTGDGDPAVLGAMLKLHWSEAHQRMLEWVMASFGPYGQLARPEPDRDTPDWVGIWLKAHAETIYAGTSEILRNIVAERGLKLPRSAR